jgi:phospho-N-acetylmuramoyl-pentapeptide-transferase
MLYHLFYEYLYKIADISIFRVFQYITFRTAYATLTALIISLLIGRLMINFFKRRNITQVVRENYYLEGHKYKSSVPTMGGFIILIALITSTLLWTRWDIKHTWLLIATALSLGAVGFIDDYLKYIRKSHKGLIVKNKLCLQIIIGLIIGLVLWLYPVCDQHDRIFIPFTKGLFIKLGIMYIFFAAL